MYTNPLRLLMRVYKSIVFVNACIDCEQKKAGVGWWSSGDSSQQDVRAEQIAEHLF